MARVDDVVEKRLDTDPKLQYIPADDVHRELLKELDRRAHMSFDRQLDAD